jgi:hypothetical protein
VLVEGFVLHRQLRYLLHEVVDLRDGGVLVVPERGVPVNSGRMSACERFISTEEDDRSPIHCREATRPKSDVGGSAHQHQSFDEFWATSVPTHSSLHTTPTGRVQCSTIIPARLPCTLPTQPECKQTYRRTSASQHHRHRTIDSCCSSFTTLTAFTTEPIPIAAVSTCTIHHQTSAPLSDVDGLLLQVAAQPLNRKISDLREDSVVVVERHGHLVASPGGCFERRCCRG